MDTKKSKTLTDSEALKLAHHPTVIAAEILAEAIKTGATEIAGAMRTAGKSATSFARWTTC